MDIREIITKVKRKVKLQNFELKQSSVFFQVSITSTTQFDGSDPRTIQEPVYIFPAYAIKDNLVLVKCQIHKLINYMRDTSTDI